MQGNVRSLRKSSLTELLGSYMDVPARFAPPTYAVRSVARAFDRRTAQDAAARLAPAYDVAMEGDSPSAPGDEETTPPA
jgi:hypothetical protein